MKYVLALIVVVVAIVLIRALSLKPTEAKEAKIVLDNSGRSVEYG